MLDPPFPRIASKNISNLPQPWRESPEVLHRINAVEQSDTDLRLCPQISYPLAYFVNSLQCVIAILAVFWDSLYLGAYERVVTIFY